MQANVLDMFHGDDREAMPDFKTLAASGIVGIIHKATQGTSYVDPKYSSRIAAAMDAGLAVGAYHFGDGHESGTNQADYFLRHSLPLPSKFGLFVLDFERNTTQMSVSGALEFLTSLRTEGFNPVIYGSDLVRENAKALTAPCLSYIWPLWLAEYGPHENIPAPWNTQTAIGWQFSESGSVKGINGHVDSNLFFGGNAALLRAQWGKPCLIASSAT